MKKVIYCLIVFCFTFLLSISFIDAATEITQMPYTITKSGSYIINKNFWTATNGIIVKANNVTIDLNGYTISGNKKGTYHGIYMNGRTNVEIRNGIVRNFGGNGIYEENVIDIDAPSHRVVNVRAIGNGGNGIRLIGSGHLVKDCTASRNGGDGIHCWGCILSGNIASYNSDSGIAAGDGSIVIGNTAIYNVGIGISVADGVLVSNNCVRKNGSHGIHTDGGGSIVGNAVQRNAANGINVEGGCTVKNNTVDENGNYGIWLSGDSLVDGNTSISNTNHNISPCATCTFGLNHAP